ncbi:MAG: DUF4388 domain-containing protein [bacterium]
MARQRLDQILLARGLVTEDQIRQALMRQKSHGGRLGTHLLYLRFVSEKQLIEALEQHFGVPGIELGGRQVPEDVIRAVPDKIVLEGLVFPFGFDVDTRTLHLAVVDPENPAAVDQARRAAMAREARVYVAAESTLHAAIQVHYRKGSWKDATAQIVELPELFVETDRERAGADETGRDDTLPSPIPQRDVVLVSRTSFLKTFLVPIFEREGCSLSVIGDPDLLASYLQERRPDHILVGGDLEGELAEWERSGRVSLPRVERVSVSSVSGSLLDQAVPYDRMVASLLQSLMQLADHRSAGLDWTPPYADICRDVRELARSLDLNRLAVDGLQIASLMLVPAGHPAGRRGLDPFVLAVDFFADIPLSLSTARSLLFPWNTEACLRAFFQLLSGSRAPSPAPEERELLFGARILALAWFRHASAALGKGSPEEVIEALRGGHAEGRGSALGSEAVEAYIRLLGKQRKKAWSGAPDSIFVLSEPGSTCRRLSERLREAGFRLVETAEPAEVRHLYDRKRPDSIIVDYDVYPDEAAELSRLARKDPRTLLYAVTTKAGPAAVLGLLDCGFSDVFVPPLNYDILVTRIKNALAGLAHQDALMAGQHGFAGSFRELAFVDLVQALAVSQRNVRVHLARRGGETASLFLREGQVSFAACGAASGEEAVYRIMAWRDEGSFRLESVNRYPPDNVTSPTDFVLMEGCRLLDEGKL